MAERTFSQQWDFESSSSRMQLWQLISDTDLLYRFIGQLPIRTVTLSRTSDGRSRKALGYDSLYRPDIWKEEPCEWEAPRFLKIRRRYVRGYLKCLEINVNLYETDSGCRVTIRFSGRANGLSGYMLAGKTFNSGLRNRLKKAISEFDASISEGRLPAACREPKLLLQFNGLQNQTAGLAAKTGETEISQMLIDAVQYGDESSLLPLSPVKLAALWKIPLHRVLNVMFHAAKLGILNFSWDISCPECSSQLQNCDSLNDITDPLYCSCCEKEVQPDFLNTIRIRFEPHPVARRTAGRQYCTGNPARLPHRLVNSVLSPGQSQKLPSVQKEGSYRIYSRELEISSNVTISSDGDENGNLDLVCKGQPDRCQSLVPGGEITITNHSNKPITVTFEDMSLEDHYVSASEISSLPEFRNLFPTELIRDKKNIAAIKLTVLFTDLFNSSDIYNTNGDETAVSLVMEHFDVMQQVIEEERGSIVKTIGDSVMAVFPRPVYAVRAFHKAQEIFRGGNGAGNNRSILLKGGVHTGDCVAVTLNNRIDYFGNTVNIASRLVDFARGDEIVISGEVYNCPDLKTFLQHDRNALRIHHFDAELKGFNHQNFEAKRISLQRTPLRLVV
jgi:adenylate cyclase